MLGALFGKKPIQCWVIKQVDDGLLHLCEKGTLDTRQKHRQALQDMRTGHYQGGVRMGNTGIVLNSNLFATLIPLEELNLGDDYRAQWQGAQWEVSKVPQRCWTWTGRLTTQPNTLGALPRLVSTEDIGSLSKRVDTSATPHGKVVFRAHGDLEPPTRDVDDAMERARRQRRLKDDGWKDRDE
ncbi:hypothetical protein GCM10017767_02430 [Halomonas urumqiensis]|nr:hypothetical protein GCM10017767_02430 [Halomonas urumqiensis]